MRGNDHPCAWTGRRKSEIREIKEGPARSCLGMGRLLIWRLGQASLYRLQIEQIVVLASHDVGESSQISNNRAIAILPVQADHRLAQKNGLRLYIGADRAFRLSQFAPVIAVACPAVPEKVPTH